MRLMSSSARLNYSDWFRRLIVMPNKPPYLDKAIALVPVSWLVNSEFVKRREEHSKPVRSTITIGWSHVWCSRTGRLHLRVYKPQ